MFSNRQPWLRIVFLAILPSLAYADQPFAPAPPVGVGPSDAAVQLPSQIFDVPVKGPNTTKERHGEWSIYGGVYLFQPVFSTNPAFLVTSGAGNITRQVEFDYSLNIVPTVWIGYVNERGWGVRGRWFRFDHDASAGYTAAPGETVIGMSTLGLGRIPLSGVIAASSHLSVNVADVQGTCTFDGPRWSHVLGIGVRYTHLSQDYRASLSNNTTRIDVASNHNLDSVGPCFSFEAKRRIIESGFSIYGQLHAAILFGSADENDTAVNNGVLQQFTRSNTDVLPVGEMEVGGEYRRNVGRARLFLQAGFAGQAWWGGGNASNIDPVGPSSAASSNFGFLGVALRAGLRY